MTTVKVGTTSIKIYQSEGRLRPGDSGKHYDQFTLVYYDNGKRKRETFGNLARAKARAQQIAVLIERGERDVLKLTNSDRDSYLSAIRLLEPHGIPLHAAVSEYVSAREQLGGEPLLATVKEHVRKLHRVTDKKLAEVVEEMLKTKKAAGLSNRYIWSLQSHLTRFASAFHISIGSITEPLINGWLESLKVGPRSRNNIRLSIITLFKFARGRGYLRKGEATEAEATAKAKDTGGEIEIFTPQELCDLLKDADEEAQLYIAIGAFTGVRSAELLRLDWSDVNFERGHIKISAHKSKTATRRLVPISPNLSQWLAPYRNQTGKIFATRAARRARGIAKKWPNNCLRHSYASYRLAATADAARVALELGNSPAKLFSNYRELADEHDAAAWFAIAPKRSKKIVHFAA
jgi:integrase